MNEDVHVDSMTKQEAIDKVKKFFRGNKKFIQQCEVMIASTDRFLGINNEGMDLQNNSFSWEKFCRLCIAYEYYDERCKSYTRGFKTIYYRKGNQKYADRNKCGNIHDYSICIFSNGNKQDYTWNA